MSSVSHCLLGHGGVPRGASNKMLVREVKYIEVIGNQKRVKEVKAHLLQKGILRQKFELVKRGQESKL
jgi:hypothetical protein